MGIAILSFHRMLSGLYALLLPSAPAPAPAVRARNALRQHTACPAAERVRPPVPGCAAPAPARRAQPLRVVRVADPAQGRLAAGRIIISGRMADVCAELDRIAAREAAAAGAAV